MHLRCIEGNNEDEEWEISPMGAVLGRSAEADIPILDGKASRKHARIYFGEMGFIIEDLGSQNGTFVDGVKITAPADLLREHILKIGNSTFLFTKVSLQALSTLEKNNKLAALQALAAKGKRASSKKEAAHWEKQSSRPGSLKWFIAPDKDAKH